MGFEQFIFYSVVGLAAYCFWVIEKKIFKVEKENERLKEELEKFTKSGD